MANARSIIEQAARKIAVLGRGQVMPADEVQSALTTLNAMLGTFSAENGVIFNDVTQSFPISGASSYTIGTGGDFNTTPFNTITSVTVSQNGIDWTLRALNSEEYQAIAFKNIGGIPDSFYYENSTPTATLFVYPVGTGAYTINITGQKALTSFPDLTTDYPMPNGFEEMLVYNLAERLSPEYEKPVNPDIRLMAKQTKNAVMGYIQRSNYPTSEIDLADDNSGISNIYGGWIR